MATYLELSLQQDLGVAALLAEKTRKAQVIFLEKKLGKPVITSVQATFWGSLRAAGIEDRIEGCGRLLAEH